MKTTQKTKQNKNSPKKLKSELPRLDHDKTPKLDYNSLCGDNSKNMGVELFYIPSSMFNIFS